MKRGRLLAAFWILLGLAFLTKGPPALLPLLPITVWRVLARRRGAEPVPLWSTVGFAGFLVVGFSWYLWAVATTPGLLGYFLGEEVVARVATDRFGRNPAWWAPPVVYGPPLALGLGAWLAWRPRRAAAELWRELRGGSSELLFLLLWLALPLLVLSLSRSRLPLYVLPFFPAIALAAARAQVQLGGTRGRISDTAGRWLAVNVSVLLLLKACAALVSSPKDMAPLAAAVEAVDPDRVVLVDTGVLYGLQFYLDVPVERARGPAEANEIVEAPRVLSTGHGERQALTVLVTRAQETAGSLRALAREGCDARSLPLVRGYRGVRVRCPTRPGP